MNKSAILTSFLALSVLFVAFAANTKELYGYIDKTGRFVIPPKYVGANAFVNGSAEVYVYQEKDHPCLAKTYNFEINKKGEIITPFKEGSEHCDNKPYIFGPDINPPNSDKSIWPQRDPDAPNLGGNRMGYQKAGTPFYKRTGVWAISPDYSEAYPFTHGVAWVQVQKGSEKYYGLINKQGKYLLSPKCVSVIDFQDGLAACKVSVKPGGFY